jgi:hypothetical protein
MIHLQTRRLRPLQYESQQLQFSEDAQHQCAVADVVAGERRLFFLIAALDLGHFVVGISDLLALAEQFLRDRFEAERRKAMLIYRRTSNLRAVQLLLGHSKIKSTVRYLGIEVDDALELSEQTEI